MSHLFVSNQVWTEQNGALWLIVRKSPDWRKLVEFEGSVRFVEAMCRWNMRQLIVGQRQMPNFDGKKMAKIGQPGGMEVVARIEAVEWRKMAKMVLEKALEEEVVAHLDLDAGNRATGNNFDNFIEFLVNFGFCSIKVSP
jgi:hypothetical protein